jgi:UDP-N-acetylglucosamine 2-epimerase (non-hydrolysing)
VESLVAVQKRLPLVFPLHPRTAQRLSATGLREVLRLSGVKLIDPLPYVRFMSLVTGAAAAITDSGGIQEETTYLGIPCLTLRENTERPITVTEGTNRLVTPQTLAAAVDQALGAPGRTRRKPDLWDGKAAIRCIEDLRRRSSSAVTRAA